MLQAKKIITSEQASQIRCMPVDSQKNTIFFEYMLKFSKEKLNTFVRILIDVDQPHVAELFKYSQGKLVSHSCFLCFKIENKTKYVIRLQKH